jgi:hypothetical protein
MKTVTVKDSKRADVAQIILWIAIFLITLFVCMSCNDTCNEYIVFSVPDEHTVCLVNEKGRKITLLVENAYCNAFNTGQIIIISK